MLDQTFDFLNTRFKILFFFSRIPGTHSLPYLLFDLLCLTIIVTLLLIPTHSTQNTHGAQTAYHTGRIVSSQLVVVAIPSTCATPTRPFFYLLVQPAPDFSPGTRVQTLGRRQHCHQIPVSSFTITVSIITYIPFKILVWTGDRPFDTLIFTFASLILSQPHLKQPTLTSKHHTTGSIGTSRPTTKSVSHTTLKTFDTTTTTTNNTKLTAYKPTCQTKHVQLQNPRACVLRLRHRGHCSHLRTTMPRRRAGQRRVRGPG